MASHPAWHCSLATPNEPSDGDLIRGDAATIAAPQVPAVEKTPLFSLRENAIAKESGLGYLEPWRCVS